MRKNMTRSFSMRNERHDTTDYTFEEIPLDIFEKLCADNDGCFIQLKMKKWNAGDGHLHIALSKWVSVKYDSNTGAWTSNPVFHQGACVGCVYGLDGRNDEIVNERDRNHLLQEFTQGNRSSACYLTDRESPPSGDGGDSRRGIHLLSATASYNVSDRWCGITIRD